MQVTQELREFWSKYTEHKDVNALAKKTGVHRTTISRILNGATDEASAKTVQKINEYFKKRKFEVEKAQTIETE